MTAVRIEPQPESYESTLTHLHLCLICILLETKVSVLYFIAADILV